MRRKKKAFRLSDLNKPQYRPLLKILGIFLLIDLVAIIIFVSTGKKNRNRVAEEETFVSETGSLGSEAETSQPEISYFNYDNDSDTTPVSDYSYTSAGSVVLPLLSNSSDLGTQTIRHYTERTNPRGIGFTAWYEKPSEVFTPLIDQMRQGVSPETLALNDEIMDSVFEAESVFLCDQDWNVLYAKNEHRQLWPGSTTKLMTAILVLDNVEDLDAYFTVGDLYGCYEEGAVNMGLCEGDRITYITLMNAMLLCSYNDTATAFALEVGGTIDHFVEMMNEKAQELGMYESHYVSPHGLFDYDHYTTAYDMTILMKTALSYPVIQSILLKKAEWIGYEDYEGEHQTILMENINSFCTGEYKIDDFEYLGGKTGYTRIARSNVLTVWKYGDMTLYCSILRALDANYQTKLLMDYYFHPDQVEPFSETEPRKKAFQVENEGL